MIPKTRYPKKENTKQVTRVINSNLLSSWFSQQPNKSSCIEKHTQKNHFDNAIKKECLKIHKLKKKNQLLINCLAHHGWMPLDYPATSSGGWGQLPVGFSA